MPSVTKIRRDLAKVRLVQVLAQKLLRTGEVRAAVAAVDRVSRAVGNAPEPTQQAVLFILDGQAFTYPRPVPVGVLREWTRNVREYDLDYAASIAAMDLLGDQYHLVPKKYLAKVHEAVIAVMTKECERWRASS